MDRLKDFIIIGAGLSGLNLAKKIKDDGLGSVLILEKSRGVGGRMATRRTLGTRFDHGAQFYKAKTDISFLHDFWKTSGESRQWFSAENYEHWCAPLGMTALAKSLTPEIEIALEKQIRTIQVENGFWKIISEKNEEWICKNLVITSPLPQTINLFEDKNVLERVNLPLLDEIKKINYSKALIGLLVCEEDLSLEKYQEFQETNIFSISNQKSKGVSDVYAVTVTMSADFSERFFELSEDVVLGKVLSEFMELYPNARIKFSELKKWRYCKPLTQNKNKFLEIAPRIYLIGDAFGGASLLGAVRSSNALFKALSEGKK